MMSEEFDFEGDGEEQGYGPTGYTILGHCGPDRAAQLRQVDYHLAQAGKAQRRAAWLAGPLEDEMLRLQGVVADIRKQEAHEVEHHRMVVAIWLEDSGAREELGATIPLLHGKVVTRKTPGKTKIDDSEVLALYQEDGEDKYSDLLCLAVVAGAVRNRFALQPDGSVVDKDTGEVVDRRIIKQVEAPGISVTLEPAETPE